MMIDIAQLNHPDITIRLDALTKIISHEKSVHDLPLERSFDANNHIHTCYSFSPYSPTYAAYKAYRAGLQIAGIIDHDTLSGVLEFHQAARILGIASTGGVEMRVKYDRGFGTINNPDQPDTMYMIAHGVPVSSIADFNRFLAPYRAHREQRNRAMTVRLNRLLISENIRLDYDQDIRPLSQAAEGGSVTERHLLYALARKMDVRYGHTKPLLETIQKIFHVIPSAKQRQWLLDPDNPLFTYDLLSLLKTNTSQFFLPATLELPDAETFVMAAKQFHAIPAYAYLGDVGVSVTHDKRPQTFEDAYLDQLMASLRQIGVPAIAYMPTRNTLTQLERLQTLCRQEGFLEISGEDINSPRQEFICDAYQNPTYHHLIDSAWSLVGHETLANQDPDSGFFGTKYQTASLQERLAFFSEIGRNSRRKLQ
jgi:hypothetical protein